MSILLIFVIVYLLVTLLIGWWAARRVKNTQDYVIAGRKMPRFVAACALFATWYGSETVMGAPAKFSEEGLQGVIEDPFGSSLCLILVGLFFARPLYRLNILTLVDFFKLRFSRRTETIAAIFIVPSYFGWIAAQMVAMALILNVLIGVDLPWGILICLVVVVFYTYIGGMWSISVTDFVQTIMIVIGMIAVAVLLANEAGGVQKVMEKAPANAFQFFPNRDLQSILTYFAAWITIGLGSIPQQDVFQRVMSAKSEKSAVGASLLSGFMYLTIGMIPLFITLCGHALYADFGDDDPQKMIPLMVLRHTSTFMQILFFGALLSAILSTTSGAILAPATIIGENLIKPIYRKMSDAMLLRTMRFSVVGVAVCSAVMATTNSNIYELVSDSSVLSLVSLFVPLTAGLYWKRASEIGSLLSILGGMGGWIVGEILETTTPTLLFGLGSSIAFMVLGSLLVPDKTYEAFKEKTAMPVVEDLRK